MDNALKQRVLGVIVLFALIGICITVLLHNNKVAQQQGLQHARQIIASSQKATPPQQTTVTTQTAVVSQQPATPTTDSVFSNDNAVESTPPPASQTVESAPIPQTSQASVHHTRTKTKSTTETTATPTTPATTSTTFSTTTTTTASPTATFSVQVGTFSNRENATALVKALHERGFSSATTQSIKTKRGSMTRVVIGENGLTRKEAETIKLHLSKNLHLNGVISPLGKTKQITHTAHHNTKTTKITTKKTATKTHTPATTTNDTTSNDSGAVVIP